MSAADELRIDREHLARWCKGDEDAVRFLMQFFYACHFWDDLVDGDHDRSTEVVDVMWLCMVDIPANPFYRQHFDALHPVIVAAGNDWLAANELERKGDLDIAYTLRCSILTVVAHAAYIIGGPLWAREVGLEIRRYGQRQTLQEYKEEHHA